jgi:hypothetical protein
MRHLKPFLLILLLSLSVAAQDERESLKDLRALGVVYQTMPAEKVVLEKAGVFGASILETVTLRLRENGIRVLEGDQGGSTLGNPKLIIVVSLAYREDADMMFFNAKVIVKQTVTLTRLKNSSIFHATTWESPDFSSSGSFINHQLSSKAKERINTAVDRFLNAYLAVNPR